MGHFKLTFNQRLYRADPELRKRSKERSNARYARLKQEGGPELRIVQLRKSLYQARQIIDQHLDAVAYQEKRLFEFTTELEALLKQRGNR